MKDLVKHNSELIKQQCCKLIVRSGIKNLQARRFFIKEFKMAISCRGPNRGAILQTKKDKRIEASQ